jgi:hypothetical protein
MHLVDSQEVVVPALIMSLLHFLLAMAPVAPLELYGAEHQMAHLLLDHFLQPTQVIYNVK